MFDMRKKEILGEKKFSSVDYNYSTTGREAPP